MPLLPPRAFDAATAWAAERNALWRLPILLWFAWTASGHLRDPLQGSILSGLIFGAHEFGHLAFALFGELLTILGGSLMQLLVPIGAAAAMAQARDWFGVACALCLLGASCGDLALYIGDARALELDLVSFSPDGGDHDWRWLLDRWGLLRQDQAIARLVRGVGWVCVGVGSLGGGWLLTQMRWRLSAPPTPPA